MAAPSRQREDALTIIRAAIAAADPAKLVRGALRLEGEQLEVAGGLEVYDLSRFQNIYIVGAGKAGAHMAGAIESVLGERITAGKVVVKDGYGGSTAVRQSGGPPAPSRIGILEAAHPIPGERGARAAREILELAGRAGEDDLVICLISGGGSALMTLPAAGLTLTDLQRANEALLGSGAAIGEVNTVRKHLTLASGGRLAAAAFPATVLTLIISDVIGDSLDTIASGPTVADATTFAGALDVIRKYGLEEQMPAAVIKHLRDGAMGKEPETPKPGGPVFQRVRNVILCSNRTALDAAAGSAAGLGYHTLTLTSLLEGEAREVARVFAALAREEEVRGGPEPLPACLLAGGETTVTVRGQGKGGRAQEFALAAALAMAGLDNSLVFAAGTDGTDGPTDADGAFADGNTAARARGRGLDPEAHLADNDSYPFFQGLGDLIVTGPTGTNVNDIYGVLVGMV